MEMLCSTEYSPGSFWPPSLGTWLPKLAHFHTRSSYGLRHEETCLTVEATKAQQGEKVCLRATVGLVADQGQNSQLDPLPPCVPSGGVRPPSQL